MRLYKFGIRGRAHSHTFAHLLIKTMTPKFSRASTHAQIRILETATSAFLLQKVAKAFASSKLAFALPSRVLSASMDWQLLTAHSTRL